MSLQFKIPQNVQREDQILSFLTFRQLGVLAGGGLVSYFFYITLAPFFYIEIWGPLVFFPCVIAVCVAFLDIGGVSFTKWVLLFSEFNLRPRKRIWNNKFSLENEIKAMLIQSPKVTEKKKSDPFITKQPKTLQQLVQEIDQSQSTLSDPSLSLQKTEDHPLDEKEAKKHELLASLITQPRVEPVLKNPQKPLIQVPIQGEPEKILQATDEKIASVQSSQNSLPDTEKSEKDDTQRILEENLLKIQALRNNSFSST